MTGWRSPFAVYVVGGGTTLFEQEDLPAVVLQKVVIVIDVASNAINGHAQIDSSGFNEPGVSAFIIATEGATALSSAIDIEFQDTGAAPGVYKDKITITVVAG